MFRILFLLFIFVPMIEIALFIQIGGLLGFWPTMFLVLITAFVGANLVRGQSIMTAVSIQQRLSQGDIPAQQMLEGVMLAVAGAMLLTPGFMTDALGILVLLPAPRAWLAKELMKRAKNNSNVHFQSYHQQTHHQHQDDFYDSKESSGSTIEGEFERKEDQNRLD